MSNKPSPVEVALKILELNIKTSSTSISQLPLVIQNVINEYTKVIKDLELKIQVLEAKLKPYQTKDKVKKEK